MVSSIIEFPDDELNWVRDAVAHERERIPDDSDQYDPSEIDECLVEAERRLTDAIESRPIDEGLVALLRRGCSPAEALDYYAVEHRGISHSDWAAERDVTQQAVSKNVVAARNKLS